MISICSVTYRSLADTKTFVESVFENTTEPFELVLGVNGPTEPDLVDFLEGLERRSSVRLVWSPRNIGVRLFYTVMRAAQGTFLYRTDSDIVVKELDWTRKMRDQWLASRAECGLVAAVGTSLARPYLAQRAFHTVEPDLLMSNCIFVSPDAWRLRERLREALPRMEECALERKKVPESYAGEHADLGHALDYARYHAPFWDPNFGGWQDQVAYGADDILWSLLIRWAGLGQIVSSVHVEHKDASMRPEWAEERNRLVGRGFQYLRTVCSLVMDTWSQECWNGLPFNLPILAKFYAICKSAPKEHVRKVDFLDAIRSGQ